MILRKIQIKNGAFILFDTLVQNGVEYIFGYPGGAILPLYDELFHWEENNLIKHILVRHEQSASHAADAYSRTTNKVGVCFATSGPGATNLVTGIATAKMDSIPLIIITGQVARSFIGTDAFQETDIFSITLPIVKHSYIVKDLKKLPEIITEAFFLAQNGRPGPILIDIPKDIGLEEFKDYKEKNICEISSGKNYKNDFFVKEKHFKLFFSYLKQSYQPLFYAGGGTIKNKSSKALQLMSKLFQIPITTTLMGKGSSNEEDYLSLGMLGMHGTAYANFAVSECDLLLAVGSRFDDRVTGKLDEFACEADVVHLDIDNNEIAKNRYPQFSLLGDSREIFVNLLKFQKKIKRLEKFQTKNWIKKITKWKKLYPIFSLSYKNENLVPQEIIQLLGKYFANGIFTTDVGQHQMWSAQFLNMEAQKWASSAGLGTMGFGLPAAIGCKIGNPNQEVICISGDSSFQMNLQELSTILQYELNLKIFIINNGWQGMVRQWQESFYGNRYSNSYMRNGMPDFVLLAKAYNISAINIDNLKDFHNFLTTTEHLKNKTLLMNINVKENENCYPMVAPGRSNSQMLGIKKN